MNVILFYSRRCCDALISIRAAEVTLGMQNWKGNAVPRANGDNYASNGLGVCFCPCLSLKSSVQEIWTAGQTRFEPLEAHKVVYKIKAFGLHT